MSNENIEELVAAISKCPEKDTVLRAHMVFDVLVGFLAWDNKDELAKCLQDFVSAGKFSQEELDWFHGVIDAIHKKEPTWECYLLKTRAALTAVRRSGLKALATHEGIVRHPSGDVDTRDPKEARTRNRWALADNAGVLMVCPEMVGGFSHVFLAHPLLEKKDNESRKGEHDGDV